VDNSLYFMANTQVDKLSARGTMPSVEKLNKIAVVRLNL
jgi:hypothetical protein